MNPDVIQQSENNASHFVVNSVVVCLLLLLLCISMIKLIIAAMKLNMVTGIHSIATIVITELDIVRLMEVFAGKH